MTDYATRRTKLLEYHRRKYEENPEHYRSLSREYYATHKEIHKERVKKSKDDRRNLP